MSVYSENVKKNIYNLKKECEEKLSVSYVANTPFKFQKNTELIISVIAMLFMFVPLFLIITNFGKINLFELENNSKIIIIGVVLFFAFMIINGIVSTITKEYIVNISIPGKKLIVKTSSLKKEKEYDFDLKQIVLTTERIVRRRSEDSSFYDEYYYINIIDKNKRKRKLEIKPGGMEDYHAFLMYLKSLCYEIDLDKLSELEFDTLYNSITNGKVGLYLDDSPKKVYGIVGLVLSDIFIIGIIQEIRAFLRNKETVSLLNIDIGATIFMLIIGGLGIYLLIIYMRQRIKYNDNLNKTIQAKNNSLM